MKTKLYISKIVQFIFFISTICGTAWGKDNREIIHPKHVLQIPETERGVQPGKIEYGEEIKVFTMNGRLLSIDLFENKIVSDLSLERLLGSQDRLRAEWTPQGAFIVVLDAYLKKFAFIDPLNGRIFRQVEVPGIWTEPFFPIDNNSRKILIGGIDESAAFIFDSESNSINRVPNAGTGKIWGYPALNQSERFLAIPTRGYNHIIDFEESRDYFLDCDNARCDSVIDIHPLFLGKQTLGLCYDRYTYSISEWNSFLDVWELGGERPIRLRRLHYPRSQPCPQIASINQEGTLLAATEYDWSNRGKKSITIWDFETWMPIAKLISTVPPNELDTQTIYWASFIGESSYFSALSTQSGKSYIETWKLPITDL